MNKKELINEILSHKLCIDDRYNTIARYLINNEYTNDYYQINDDIYHYYYNISNNNILHNAIISILDIDLSDNNINIDNNLFICAVYDSNNNYCDFYISDNVIEYNNCIHYSEKLNNEYFSEA